MDIQDIDAKAPRTPGAPAAAAIAHEHERFAAADDPAVLAEQLRAILDSAVAAIITVDDRGVIETINRNGLELFGWRLDELVGCPISVLMPEPDRSQHDRYMAEYLRTGKARIIGVGRELVGQKRCGTVFPIHLAISEFVSGGTRRYTGIITDLTRLKETQRQLDRGEALFRAIFNAISDPIFICDPDRTIRVVNSACLEAFGYSESELVGQSSRILYADAGHWNAEGAAPRCPAAAGSDPSPVGETVHLVRRSGETFPGRIVVRQVHDRSEPFGSMTMVHDLSEELRRNAAMLRTQRMEAIGQLSGGIAHDFNNILTVILGNLELLAPRLNDREAIELQGEAQEAAVMGARLTDRLLTFARRQHLETRRINLNEFVLNLTELLRRTLGEDIDLSTSLETHLWPTVADPGQIENAVLNLAINARDAMPCGGQLVIETYNRSFARESGGAEVASPAAGDYVVLSVTDTGQGMPADVRARAFEPFYTTKGGRGSGLGLATIYGFARQSGGDATIYSEVGKGTTVNIYLPRAAGEGAASFVDARSPAPRGTGQLILVVEDDEPVRRLTLKRLQNLGYATREAESGAVALECLTRERSIALVFTDIVMPGGMSGLELARAVRQASPDTAILLTSGYSEDLVNAGELARLGIEVLRKPYREQDLGHALGRLLDRR